MKYKQFDPRRHNRGSYESGAWTICIAVWSPECDTAACCQEMECLLRSLEVHAPSGVCLYVWHNDPYEHLLMSEITQSFEPSVYVRSNTVFGHGESLDALIGLVKTEFFVVMDVDCVVLDSRWLEHPVRVFAAFPDCSVIALPNSSRWGRGKGNLEDWSAYRFDPSVLFGRTHVWHEHGFRLARAPGALFGKGKFRINFDTSAVLFQQVLSLGLHTAVGLPRDYPDKSVCHLGASARPWLAGRAKIDKKLWEQRAAKLAELLAKYRVLTAYVKTPAYKPWTLDDK